MKNILLQRRLLSLVAVIIPLVLLLLYVAVRSGPLAPVAVTLERVTVSALQPTLFGIGTVEARYHYRIGPTLPGRLKALLVDVGDPVSAGQLLGEMAPVDMDQRISALEAQRKRAEAMVQETAARHAQAKVQASRYEKLYAEQYVSEEVVTNRQQELRGAEAALKAAQEEQARTVFELQALQKQRENLLLVAPADGVITRRDVDPGTTLLAGQAAIEMVDPDSLWVNARFDQVSAAGLAAGLPARIVLHSHSRDAIPGKVLRVEPHADAVTEEMLVKVVFDQIPTPLPPIGELAEVTVDLPGLAPTPVIPDAAIQRQGAAVGVWQIVDGDLVFTSVTLGRADLEGRVQVLDGLSEGDSIVVYSEKALSARNRVHVVERIPGVPQ